MESIAIIDGVEYTHISAPIINRALLADNLSVGNCISATLKLSVLTDDVIGKSAKVVVKARLTDDVEYSEWMEFGTFYIDNRSVNSGLVTMQCYDSMLKASQQYGDETNPEDRIGWPKTMQTCVEEIAARIGIEIDPRTVIKTADPYQVPYPNKLTMMEVLGYIGACHGGNWIITPENKLRLVPLLSPPAETFNIIDHDYNKIYTGDGHKLVWQHTETGETVEHKAGGGLINVPVVVGKIETSKAFTVTRLVLTRDRELGYALGDDTGYTLMIESNPYACQAICDDLFAELNGLEYYPFSITSACYDPATELGDWMLVGDKVRSVLYSESTTLNVDFRVNASAPGKDEVGSEYPYLTKIERIQKETEELIKKYTETEKDEIYSKIEQTHTEILIAVSGTYATKDAVSSSIALTEQSIKAEVSKTYATKDAVSSDLNILAGEIVAEVERATAAEEQFSSSLKLTQDAITAEVTRATKADGELSTSITQTANKIALKVDKGGVSSEISAETGQVAIKSNRMVIESDNFTLTGTGKVTAKGTISSESEVYKTTVKDGGIAFYVYGNQVASVSGANYLSFLHGDETYSTNMECDILALSSLMDAIAIKADKWYPYVANNGLNPDGYDEPHIFYGDVRLISGYMMRAYGITLSNYSGYEVSTIMPTSDDYGAGCHISGEVFVDALYCLGEKDRLVVTDNYGTLKMHAMESGSAVFSDMGGGVIDESGKCYVYFDQRFMEVIDQTYEYQVFTTNTAETGVSHVEKSADHFIAYGTPMSTFDWLVYARQKDYAQTYFDVMKPLEFEEKTTDDSVSRGDDICADTSISHMGEFADTYDQQAEAYLKNYELEVTNYGN